MKSINYQDDQVKKRIVQQDSTFIEDILIQDTSKIYEDKCEEKLREHQCWLSNSKKKIF